MQLRNVLPFGLLFRLMQGRKIRKGVNAAARLKSTDLVHQVWAKSPVHLGDREAQETGRRAEA